MRIANYYNNELTATIRYAINGSDTAASLAPAPSASETPVAPEGVAAAAASESQPQPNPEPEPTPAPVAPTPISAAEQPTTVQQPVAEASAENTTVEGSPGEVVQEVPQVEMQVVGDGQQFDLRYTQNTQPQQ